MVNFENQFSGKIKVFSNLYDSNAGNLNLSSKLVVGRLWIIGFKLNYICEKYGEDFSIINLFFFTIFSEDQMSRRSDV